ncbi:GNAT family N-acetyltransferase [Paracoccus sp. Ld10]|uniref:GNAT family N-acetyltransferase n=1 Tax=Paracoccus sp. Ld10 TaxID=649158 RepID=UPI0038701FA3
MMMSSARGKPRSLPYARLADPASYALPQVVRTSRLLLRPTAVDDAAALAEARSESYAELFPWFHPVMGTPDQENDAQWQSERLAQSAEAARRRERLSYFAWAWGACVGAVDLVPLWRRGQFRLSYWVRSSAAGQGYGAEAVNAMIRTAFEVLDARLVTTGHAAPNAASARLAQKLGFRQIAQQPLGCELPYGLLVDGIACAIEDIALLPPLNVSWG